MALVGLAAADWRDLPAEAVALALRYAMLLTYLGEVRMTPRLRSAWTRIAITADQPAHRSRSSLSRPRRLFRVAAIDADNASAVSSSMVR